MSFTTYFKTIWFSTLLFIGSAFASAPPLAKASEGWPAPAQIPAHLQRSIACKITPCGLSIPCVPLKPISNVREKLYATIKAICNDELDHLKLRVLLPQKPCFVWECDCLAFDRQTTSRRKDVEESVVNASINSFDRSKLLQVCSYGSGLLFQDLVMITKLIFQGGYKQISLVLIDGYYEDFFKSLKKDQTSLKKMPMDIENDATTVNNALIYLATYFGFLKGLHSGIDVTITVYDSVQKAMQELSPKSFQFLYAIDTGMPENISEEKEKRNQFLAISHMPNLRMPYRKIESNEIVLSAYANLAHFLLQEQGFIHICSDETNPGGKTSSVDGIAKYIPWGQEKRTYLYHLQNKSDFGLLIDNRYLFFIDNNDIRIVDSKNSIQASMRKLENQFSFLRPLLQSCAPLSKDQIASLNQWLKTLN